MIVHFYIHRLFSRQRVMTFLLGGVLCVMTGCHYYQEYRVLKTKADVQEEQAELLSAYRQCLAKYQDDPSKTKEICAAYTQSLREVEGRHQSAR